MQAEGCVGVCARMCLRVCLRVRAQACASVCFWLWPAVDGCVLAGAHRLNDHKE